MTESAFGVDHAISKRFNPFRAAKAKPAAAKTYEDPFAKPSTGGKGLTAKEFEGTIIKPKPYKRPTKTSNPYNRNAGLNSAYGGNQGGFTTQTRRQKDLG